MRFFDFSSWQAILTSIAGILLVTLIGMGIRLLMMMTLQQRRERQNRQINERLKALIAAYKALGGSFTGTLTVDPTHLRELRLAETDEAVPDAVVAGSERARRVRDAVEAALSDVVLFGTEKQVELAAAAMRDMVAGKPVHVHALVVSLRAYIREVLDLEAIPAGVVIPDQGPARPSSSGGGRSGGESRARGGGGGMGGGGMMMGGMGLGAGLGAPTEGEAGPKG
jgi:uncharacterized membrane protein YgcG